MWAPCLTKGKDNKKPLTSGEVPSLRGGEGFFCKVSSSQSACADSSPKGRALYNANFQV